MTQLNTIKSFTPTCGGQRVKLPNFTLRTVDYFIHLTLDFTLSMDDALSAGVAGVGLAIPTGPLRLTAMSLIPNVASLTGTTSEWALMAHRGSRQIISLIRASISPCSYISTVAIELQTTELSSRRKKLCIILELTWVIMTQCPCSI